MMKNENQNKQQQADAMEATLSTAIIQGFGARLAREVSHILAKVDIVNDKTEIFADEQPVGERELQAVNDYKTTMMPAINGESTERNCKPVGFELEITKATGRFRLEVFGDDITTGEPMSFLIPAVELVHYAK